MKKVFGILLLIIGLLLTNFGVGGFVYTDTTRKCDFYQNLNDINNYHKDYDGEMAVGMAIFLVGLILFIIGIVLTASKTRKQQEIEIELGLIKSQNIK